MHRHANSIIEHLILSLFLLASHVVFANQVPQISITEPISGSSLNGLVMVSGSASDDVGIDAIEIKIGDADWIDIPPAANWEFEWITYDRREQSELEVRARVTDLDGLESEAAITVDVVNPLIVVPQDAIVVAVGDSITAGSNTNTDWPSELQVLLHDAGRTDVQIFNEGEGGLSTRELWLDADHEGNKRSDIQAYDSIDIAFIMIGHNDTRSDDLVWHNISPTEHEQFISDAISWLQSRINLNGATTKVVLLTPIAAREPVTRNHWNFPQNFNQVMQQSDGYVDRAIRTAESLGAEIIYTLPVYDGGQSNFEFFRRADSSLLTGDTIHPNAAGQRAIANAVFAALTSSDATPSEEVEPESLPFVPKIGVFVFGVLLLLGYRRSQQS